jgi:hypothetical protein
VGGAAGPAGAGGVAGVGGGAPGGAASASEEPACAKDITAAVLANQSVVLVGDSCVVLPAATTQYDGVISGEGTLRLEAASGPATLVLTADSTFSLPQAQQTETASETKSPSDPNHVHYWVIQSPNPPAVFIDAGVALQLGTPASSSGTIGDYLPNTAGTTINLDNMRVNGTLVLESGPTQHLGIISGNGVIERPAVGSAGGTLNMVGDNPFSGVYSQFFGGYFGTDHVLFSLRQATIFSNESFITSAPEGLFGASASSVLSYPQTIWESHYGDDINTDSGHVIFAGVYSYSNSGDPLKPSLSDPTLNTMLVKNASGSPTGGSNSSFRGINIEGGTTQWGDGTTSAFFLPSAPAPAAPDSTVKNAYINLHQGSTLVFDYNGHYVCNIGITGGGGGPKADGSVGVGNLTIAPTAGNYAVLTMPQNYNGTTTIGAGATLQLGNGSEVQALQATVGAPTTAEPNGAVTGTALVATYSGDSSLLTADSPSGAATDAIVNDGQLIIDNTTTMITLSHITGAGTVTQTGSAMATILASSYGGGTWIEHGGLLVGDERGLGVGGVHNDAVLGAMGAARIIRVAQNYVQGVGGVLRLRSNRRGQTDVLRVAGTATLAGQLELRFPDGALREGQRLPLVHANRGIVGQFRAIVVNGAEALASYDATTCYVSVSPKRRPPARPRPRRSAKAHTASSRRAAVHGTGSGA